MKKTIAMISICIMTAVFTLCAGAPNAGVRGDINGDGVIDTREAIYALQVSAGLYPDVDPSCALTGEGAWTVGENYLECDVVEYGGDYYISIVAHTAQAGVNEPPEPAYWNALPLQGDPGALPLEISGDDVYLTTGNFGIGTDAPATALDVAGTVTASDLNVGGSATASSLDVLGTATATDLNVSGTATATDLNVSGFATLSSLNVSGTVTADGYVGDGSHLTGVLQASPVEERWFLKDEKREWSDVAMSSDGSMQTAVVDLHGHIYASSDYGDTWRRAYMWDYNWTSVAMSSDGSVQTAVAYPGAIYVSVDSGETWVQKTSDTNGWWRGVAMSSDGAIQTAIYDGFGLYVSTDYGDAWTKIAVSPLTASVAMSSDGEIQTAVAWSGQIYVSTDYWDTWTEKDQSRAWASVAMSSDGSVQTAVVDGGQIYVSTDNGNTWTAKDSNRAWASVAMSSDGSVQTAVTDGGQIYVSGDYGDTWTAEDANRSWKSVAMSSDGSVQTAVVYEGRIYVRKKTVSIPIALDVLDVSKTMSAGTASINDVLELRPLSTTPDNPVAGTIYIDAADGNKLKVYDGAAWQSCW